MTAPSLKGDTVVPFGDLDELIVRIDDKATSRR
jgi:hypothetical protein